jgi:undecaprenyl-diphosphatase
MITIVQAIILGILQGAAELFPVSSLGHSVILPQLLGWNIHENDNSFIIFLVATHFATSLVLLFFYGKTWLDVARGMIRSFREREIKQSDSAAKLGWLLVVGTVPAGIIGLLFQDQIRAIFVTGTSAAFFLMINGLLLLGAERLRRRAKTNALGSSVKQRLAKVSWAQSVKVGMAQSLALIPGFSRTGVTMGGGLLVGLSNEDAAHFAFLLATPIILAAAVLKLPELASPANSHLVMPSLVGAIAAAISAYISVKFLTRYFQTRSLKPFGIYCLVAGAICSLIFLH